MATSAVPVAVKVTLLGTVHSQLPILGVVGGSRGKKLGVSNIPPIGTYKELTVFITSR